MSMVQTWKFGIERLRDSKNNCCAFRMIMRCVFECCKNANVRCHLFNFFYLFFQFLGANTAQATWTRWENGIMVSTVQVSKLKTFFSLSLTPVANKLECSSLASYFVV
jgi:hypothetical protein